MENIKFKVEKNKLVIEVDLTEELRESASGKNMMIATSGGNVDAGQDGVKFGLNVYKPVKKKPGK